MTDKLDATFEKFFGPTDVTRGSGMIRRTGLGGEVHTVIVNRAEHECWTAAHETEAAERNAKEAALQELMDRLNN